MIKLLDILLESIRESNPIRISKEVFPQIEYLWKNYSIVSYEMRSKGEEGKEVLIGSIKMKNPYKPGEKLEIPVYAKYLNKEIGAGYFSKNKNRIIVNTKIVEDKEDFIHVMHHELIHSVDPKMGKLKSVTPGLSNRQLYATSPKEFDAETSTYLPILSRNLKKATKEDQEIFKTDLKKFINDLLSRDVKFKSGTKIIVDYDGLLSFFDSGFSREKFSELVSGLLQMDDKSIIKKFVQRLSTLL